MTKFLTISFGVLFLFSCGNPGTGSHPVNGSTELAQKHVHVVPSRLTASVRGYLSSSYKIELQEDGKPIASDTGMQASAEMFMYAGKLRERALTNAGDDLASALVRAELDGEKLTEADFNFFFLLMLIAGNETTRTVTSNGMISLLDNPEQLRDLKRDPSLVDSTVEEVLRYAPAVHSFRRTATEDPEPWSARTQPRRQRTAEQKRE